MKVRLCKTCGFQLYRHSKKCPWCKALVKKKSALPYLISALIMATGLFLFKTDFSKKFRPDTPPTSEPVPTRAVQPVKVAPPVKFSQESLARIFVKGEVANIRQQPTIKSLAIGKSKKGQELTKLARSGNWFQVRVNDQAGRKGWIHASLVGKTLPDPSSKAVTQHQAFNLFRKYFQQFNADIKAQKGTTFFEHVEYLDRGVIQVTATNIFLSAPELYKNKYVGKIARKWLEMKKKGRSGGVVRIVDAEGILRMEKKPY